MARSKFVKKVIRVVCGLIVVFYIVINGNIVGSYRVLASPLDVSKCTVAEVMKRGDFHATINGMANIKRDSKINKSILEEANTTMAFSKVAASENIKKAEDIQFLQFIVATEKRFGLEPCELLALTHTENSFTSITAPEADGIISYNCCQMRLDTAKVVWKGLAAKGINIPAPTDALMRNDRYYCVVLTGSYLQDLHQAYPNKLQAWTAYNAGEFRMKHFASRGYHYSYTDRITARIADFKPILGNLY